MTAYVPSVRRFFDSAYASLRMTNLGGCYIGAFDRCPITQQNSLLPTSLRDAFRDRWILPRPKKVSPGHFFTPAAPGPAFRIPHTINKKDPPPWGGSFLLAEQQGFEPWRRFHALRDFESRLFDQLEYCSITESLYQQSEEKSILSLLKSLSVGATLGRPPSRRGGKS